MQRNAEVGLFTKPSRFRTELPRRGEHGGRIGVHGINRGNWFRLKDGKEGRVVGSHLHLSL